MAALVAARAQEPSFDVRTTGASDAAYDAAGPGHAGGAVPAGAARNGSSA